MAAQTNTLNIGKISAIKTLRFKVIELSEIMEELGEPILHDQSLLPLIYEAYKSVFAKRGNAADALTVRNRKKFLMVVLYLYSPTSLAGERMRMGLRKKIAKLFDLSTSTPISDNTSGLLTQYFAYADFRDDVGEIFNAVAEVIPEIQNAD